MSNALDPNRIPNLSLSVWWATFSKLPFFAKCATFLHIRESSVFDKAVVVRDNLTGKAVDPNAD